MLLPVVVFSLLAQFSLCHPTPESIKIPLLDVSPPEVINNLHADQNYNMKEVVRVRLPSTDKSQINVDKTVEEVQELLKLNPSLPRLTRGEILDIIENITTSDLEKLKKAREQKAIMLVMPFTPKNNSDFNIQDLYTRRPVTHLIDDSVKTEEIKRPVRRRRPTLTTDSPKPSISDFKLIDNEPKPFSQQHTNEQPGEEVKPVRKQIYRKRKPEIMTPKPYVDSSTEKPKKRRTTPGRHPNHRYPDDMVSPKPTKSGGMVVVEAPALGPRPEMFNSQDQNKQDGFSFKPQSLEKLIGAPVNEKTEKHPVLEDVNLPDDLKSVIDDLDLGTASSLKEPTFATYEADNPQVEDIKFPPVAFGQTTNAKMPDLNGIVDTLTPEMKDLLMSFGLIPNPNSTPTPIRTEQPFLPKNAEINADSYIKFKPLPKDAPTRDDMEEFLSRFGLGKSSNRDNKSLPPKEQPKVLTDVPEIDPDMIPDSAKDILGDLGLFRQEKKIRNVGDTKTEKKHVFNPTDSQTTTEAELKKLGQLMDIIKQLEYLNGTATDEDLKKIDLNNLKELVGSLNGDTYVPLGEQKGAPNPLDFDYSVSKNEIKRQQNSTTTESSASVSVSATEETQTPNIKDLEDSFGGASDTDVATTATTTKPNKSGFYYLLDWNTFFEIDNQEGKRVNLRFQPKAGDPSRFLSVSVP